MDSLTSVFPYLDQLLGGYFNVDWTMDFDTEEEVINHFTSCSHALTVWATVADIRRFLQYNPDADEAYRRIFPDETGPMPPMGPGEWLRWLERLIVERAPHLPE